LEKDAGGGRKLNTGPPEKEHLHLFIYEKPPSWGTGADARETHMAPVGEGREGRDLFSRGKRLTNEVSGGRR